MPSFRQDPQLQRRAWEESARRRSARAAVKREVAALPFASACDAVAAVLTVSRFEPEFKDWKLLDLLMSMEHVGRLRAVRFLDELGLGREVRLGSLSAGRVARVEVGLPYCRQKGQNALR